MLTVYKASAGSGKTFQLVVEYLKLLIDNPYNYKHILAVTFTNKATNEMKGRILEQLFLLGSNQPTKYLESLKIELDIKEEIIRTRAKQALKYILHDFNRFSVNTIDSFTQRVIKAFNRELGISPNFVLELDNSMILDEAVDQLLSKIDQNKKLLDWLVKFSEEKITENQSQRIEEDIKALGRELFNEKFQMFFSEEGKESYKRGNINSLKSDLNKIIKLFENNYKKKAATGIQLMTDHGFTVNDFSYKLSGVAGFIFKASEGEIKEPSPRILEAEESPDKWISKTHKHRTELLNLVETRLQPLLREMLSFYREKSTQYYSAKAVNNQLRILGILTDLKEEITQLLKDKSILQISDSNLLLSKIIGESESPFVYEKIGNYFKYFMLDEFQDTSALQWKNFKPLLANSLAEGNPNLLVGDVKQSIYRWRNSDWNILAQQVVSDFPRFQSEIKNLSKNWRSDKNIITFNNAVIGNLKDAFNNILFAENKDDDWLNLQKNFNDVYSEFKQDPGDSSAKDIGFVQVNFLEEENFESSSLESLILKVKELQDMGIKAADISILIRRNKEGTKIIDAFLSASKQPENARYNFSVLSNESLFLHASKAVVFVVYLIELLIDPKNLITKTAILHLWTSWLKPELAKQEITQTIPGKNQLELDFSANTEGTWQLENDIEATFENELGVKFREVKQKILLTSIDETITEICSHFDLFNLSSELPFLQTLIDKAGEIKMSVSNDLSNFLFWWEEKGKFTSVSVNDEIDSMRLLTVHKAKGLEFKVVLIPFLNWTTSWSGSQAPTLWCYNEIAPFNKFPLLPVQAKTSLEKTFFKKDYYEEKVNYFVDTLNLLYVAFTRAKSALVINAPVSKTTGKNTNSLLKYGLDQMTSKPPFTNCWNEEETVFSYGQLLKDEKTKTSSDSTLITKYIFRSFSNRLSLRLNGEDFLIPGEKNKSVKNTGKLIHDILANIETINDIDFACNKAFNEGKIDDVELQNIKNFLHENLKKPQVQEWFNGSFNILNERDLITSNKLLRPDRIMFSNEDAIVVDFKTGDKKQNKYNHQVKRYAKILKETGLKKVEGYLWYIQLNEVEKVAEF